MPNVDYRLEFLKWILKFLSLPTKVVWSWWLVASNSLGHVKVRVPTAKMQGVPHPSHRDLLQGRQEGQDVEQPETVPRASQVGSDLWDGTFLLPAVFFITRLYLLHNYVENPFTHPTSSFLISRYLAWETDVHAGARLSLRRYCDPFPIT